METKFTPEQIIVAMHGIVFNCAQTLKNLPPEQREKYAVYMFDPNSNDRIIKVYCLLNYRLVNTSVIHALLQPYNSGCLERYLKSAQTTPFKLNSKLEALIEIVIWEGNLEAFKAVLKNCKLKRNQEWKIMELRYPVDSAKKLTNDSFVEYYFAHRALSPHNLRKLSRSPYDFYFDLYRRYHKVPRRVVIRHFFSRLKRMLI